jgi:hypothetical protein
MLYEKMGMPQLSVDGMKDYQFRMLKQDDGSVKWG